jgi:hypothetical protein
VLCVFLAGVMLLVLLTDPHMRNRSSAWAISAALIGEPLSGGTGLLFVPLVALWTGYQGIQDLRRNRGRGNGVVLSAGAAIALGLCAIYFVGFQRPDLMAQESSVAERVAAIGKVLTFGFGPATRTLWWVFVPMSLVLLSWTAWAVVRAMRATSGDERARITGLATFLATLLAYAAALGWSRAGVVRAVYNGWPTRYMLLMVPLLCVVYLVWEFCGPARQRAVMHVALFAPAILLAPLNTAHGRLDGVWIAEGWRSANADLECTVPVFARRHRADLNHNATVEELAASIRMLKRAGRWPFTVLQDEDLGEGTAPPGEFVRKTIRYHLPGATESSMVWGVNGWQPLAGAPPEGTEREDGLMRTQMRRTGDSEFETSLSVPRDATLQFGFKVRDQIRNPGMGPLWEGPDSFQASSSAGPDILEVRSGLRFDEHGPYAVMTGRTVFKTIGYRSAEAADVWLVWGFRDWHPAPPELRPPHTYISRNLMQTRMSRRGNEFEAVVQVPAETKLNCGFLITERRGISNLLATVWDSRCNDTGVSPTDARAQVSLDSPHTAYLPGLQGYLIPAGAAALLWLLLRHWLELRAAQARAGAARGKQAGSCEGIAVTGDSERGH